MKRITTRQPQLTREMLANPFTNESYHERLVKAKVIDLTDNHKIIDLGNGYTKIVIIDEDKLVK